MDQTEIHKFVQELESMKLEEKLGAIRDYMDNYGVQAVALLLALLNSEFTDVRTEAVRGLSEFGTAEAVPAIFASIEPELPSHFSRETRNFLNAVNRAVDKLITEENVDILIEHLDSDNHYIREIAAKRLYSYPSDKVRRKLLTMVDDENGEARREVYRSLSRFRDHEVFEKYLNALDDEDVLDVILEWLGYFKDSRALPVLMEFASQTDEEIVERVHSVIGLGELGEPRAIEALSVIFHDSNEDFELRSAAANALAKISDEGITILRRALRSTDRTTRDLAKYGLAELILGIDE